MSDAAYATSAGGVGEPTDLVGVVPERRGVEPEGGTGPALGAAVDPADREDAGAPIRRRPDRLRRRSVQSGGPAEAAAKRAADGAHVVGRRAERRMFPEHVPEEQVGCGDRAGEPGAARPDIAEQAGRLLPEARPGRWLQAGDATRQMQ